MSYSIWPREMARVGTQTAVERDQLRETLMGVHPLLARAAQGAGRGPVVDALVDLGGEQAKATAEALARIASALVNADLAVAAYVQGDAEMAAQYGRNSVVFAGPRPAPPARGPAPLPETVTGG